MCKDKFRKGEITVTCDEFRQMLDRYEELSENEKLILTAHTSECKECRDELDFMLSIINTAKTLPEIKPCDDFLDKLNARIDLEEVRERREERKRKKLLHTDWKRYGSLAACLLLVAVVGINGRSLVSRMTDTADVITEETVTTQNGDNGAQPQSPFAADVQNAQSPMPMQTEAAIPAMPNSIVAQAQANADQKSAINAPTKTPQTPAAKATPKTGSSANNASSRPFIQNTLTPSTPIPDTMAVPNQNQPYHTPQTQPVSEYDSKGFEMATQAPSAQTPSESSQPYTLAKDGYRIPIESVPYGDRNITEEVADSGKDSVNGYSLAEDKATLALGMYTAIDKDGNPTDYGNKEEDIASVPSGSSILVSSEDEEKVRSLVDQYVTGSYGGYYMTTENKLNELLEEMDKAGIDYEKYIKNSMEKVSFKLVVVS